MIQLLPLDPLPRDIHEDIRKYSKDIWPQVTPYSDTDFEDLYIKGTNFVKRVVERDYKNTALDEFLKTLFKSKFLAYSLILIKNTCTETSAIFPPHTDYKRTVGLNYIVQTGGPAVTTSTFHLPADYIIDKPTYWNKSSLDITHELTIDEGQWVTFNAQQPHSVENVKDFRIVLMVFLPGH